MNPIVSVDTTKCVIDISRSFEVRSRELVPGSPQRTDGYTLGVVLMNEDPPHGGEIHPDGDEVLIVISGRLSVRSESSPTEVLTLGPGDACIVKRNEWHKVSVIEPAKLIHLTPGPNGDHRPVGYRDAV